MPNALTRALARIVGKANPPQEGQYRDGPWILPITGGWLPHDVGKYWNWWQMGFDPATVTPNAMVEACISSYARTIAMSPGDHWRGKDDNGRERVTTSAACRLLRRPNDYQSISDFLFNATRQLYITGNAYALALRNDRFEVAELHLMLSRVSGARIATTGDIFYHLGGNDIIEARLATAGLNMNTVPARDVLHIRLNTPRHPLIGESPLLAALADITASGAMSAQQISFYLNQARPSAVLSTEQILSKDQVDVLRELWNAQSRGLNAGGTPILSAGLKPHSLGSTAEDSQTVEALTKADEHIALALGVPLQILGAGKSAPFASTEALMRSWLAGGLGFILNHIELAFDRLFAMRGPPDEYVAFDTMMLLRSDESQRMQALSTAIKGGIKTINEARESEQLPRVKGGDDIRIQQQDVPLDWHEQQAEAEAAAAEAAANAPPDAEDDEPEESDDDERGAEWARAILTAADEITRESAERVA